MIFQYRTHIRNSQIFPKKSMPVFFFWIKFYWNTVTPSFIHIFESCFVLDNRACMFLTDIIPCGPRVRHYLSRPLKLLLSLVL